jgi:hypothetical protein
MAVVSNYKINAALSQRLQAMGESTAYENAPHTPTDGTLYLEENFLPVTSDNIGLANDSSVDHSGIYQVTVHAPSDAYKAVGFQKADAVAAQFARGTTMTYDGVTVRSEDVRQSPALQNGNRWSIPISIEYRAFN